MAVSSTCRIIAHAAPGANTSALQARPGSRSTVGGVPALRVDYRCGPVHTLRNSIDASWRASSPCFYWGRHGSTLARASGSSLVPGGRTLKEVAQVSLELARMQAAQGCASSFPSRHIAKLSDASPAPIRGGPGNVVRGRMPEGRRLRAMAMDGRQPRGAAPMTHEPNVASAESFGRRWAELRAPIRGARALPLSGETGGEYSRQNRVDSYT